MALLLKMHGTVALLLCCWHCCSVAQDYVLTPFCELTGYIHAWEAGSVPFTKDKAWWQKTAPVLARGAKLLSVGLQLAFAGMPLTLGDAVFGAIKNDVTFMKELTKHVELETDGPDEDADLLERLGARDKGDWGRDDTQTRLMRAALVKFLETLAPTQYAAGDWGGLRRVHMPDNSYRWLCEACERKVRR